jgi:hypothetical protein
MSKIAILLGCAIALVISSFAISPARAAEEKKPAAGATGTRFFEMRKYTAAPGKLDALLARFRDHTNRLFEKHGITIIGYWVPTDGEHAKDTLIYILAYPSREAREKSWKDFQADPDWQAARKESEKDGPLLIKGGVESTYMSPTDFSPIK